MNRFKIMLIGFFLLLLCGFTNCSDNNVSTKSEDAYDRVMAKGQIRVGYISYPPSLIKDPNSGQVSGIFHDVLQQVGKNLDLTIVYTEELGFGTMIEAIRSGRVDLVAAGIWPTAARGRSADFTTPLYFSTVRAYTAANNSRFDGNLGNINDPSVKIASIDGEMTSIIATSDFEKAQNKGLPQTTEISQVLLEVATNKADVTFVEPAVAGEFIDRNPGKIKEVANVPPLRFFPNVMLVQKGETRFLSMLNTAIEELINTGFVEKTLAKYEKHPGSFQRVARPYMESSAAR